MAGKMQELRGDKRSLRRTILTQMLTLTTSGFGLVAALAWNNVIQEFVNTVVRPYLPQGYGLASLFIYAIIVTVFAVSVSYQLTQLLEKIENPSGKK
jgi:hypothetical protein